MKIYLKDGNYTLAKDFPMSVFEIRDTLDRLRKFQSREVLFRLSEFGNTELPQSLCGKEFSADIYKLNLFAERYEKLKYPEAAAFKSLLKANPDSSFDDMLLMSYGLDSVPVFPCEDLHELGEMAIENDMLCELEDCSDEMLELLDREHIGQIMCERDGGMFADSYYCVPSCYERPDMNIEIGEPDKCFFRLLIAPAPANDESTEQFAQWLSLPCDKENLNDIAKDLCIGRVQDMVYYDFQSAIPSITEESFGDMRRIDELNVLAQRLSELSNHDFVKLKAVTESEEICDISDTMDCIEHLSEYEFDMFISDESEFGKAYLAKNLPTNFDNSVLEDIDLHDFGQSVLGRKEGEITSYGAISGRGQELYYAITVKSEQQLTEDISEEFSDEELEEDESGDFEMGGMLL